MKQSGNDGPLRGISFTVPIRTNNCANSLRHWRTISKERNTVRAAVELFLRQHDPLPPLPATIAMTRLSPGTMDFGGLVNALKSVQDQIADHYEVDDRDARFDWKYLQQKEKTHAVRITIEGAAQ